MANKTKSKQNNKKKPVKKQNKVQQRGLTGLDSMGAAYARLLADPCNAPLVHPTYSGVEGGYLMRADSFLTMGDNAGATSGYLQWTPSVLEPGLSGILSAATTGGAVGAIPASVGDKTPAWTYLLANCSEVRTVAACLRVTYPGAESGRAGRIHYGQTSGGMVQSTTSYSADGVATLLPHFERTPATSVELIWKPNDADQMFSYPNVADNGKNNKCASLSVAWAGLPAAVGLTFHMTVVYEWQPKPAMGISNPNMSRSSSANTLDHVVNYLQNQGFSFVRSLAMAAGSSMATGAMAATYGLMGANPSRRLTAF